MTAPAARPSAEQLARFAEEFSRSHAMRFFGVQLSFVDAQRVRARREVRPQHRGGPGTSAVDGGILAARFHLLIGCTPALLD